MQVHTREAIKRKALIPICNCFSISTVLLTGPKSGSTLSPVSNLSAAWVLLSFPFLSSPLLSSPFHPLRALGFPLDSHSRNRERDTCPVPNPDGRESTKIKRDSSFFAAAYRKQMSTPPRDRVASRREPASLPFLRRSPYDGPPFAPLNAPYRASFMFFAKPNYEPSYAHHTTAAIFRASTQFFRAHCAALAPSSLSRFPPRETIEASSRAHSRKDIFSNIDLSTSVPFTSRPNKCHFSAKVMQH